MATEKEKECEEKIEKRFKNFCSKGKTKKNIPGNNSSGFVWCLGFLGAAVYYIQQANGFWDGVVGVLKALVWPALLVYEAMKLLGM